MLFRVRLINIFQKHGKDRAMACPTQIYHGVTSQVFNCLKNELEKAGISVPDGNIGTISGSRDRLSGAPRLRPLTSTGVGGRPSQESPPTFSRRDTMASSTLLMVGIASTPPSITASAFG